jgi:hypothetical protein
MNYNGMGIEKWKKIQNEMRTTISIYNKGNEIISSCDSAYDHVFS